MKAIVRDRYGSPDVLRLEEIDTPPVGDDAVLVRVAATSVNALDWHILRGRPYFARLSEGVRRPKTRVLGVDAAGTVEAVGANVTDLKPGDRVFGSRSGAFAEYVSGRNFVPIPRGVSFADAAAVPAAGQTALQALRDKARVQPGQHVLINGAGGGVGTFAVQIAKAFGARVTAVTSSRNVEVASSIGADEVIDYTRVDFTRTGAPYDVIVDIGGNRPVTALRRALVPGGTAVLVAPGRGEIIGPIGRLVAAIVVARIGSRKLRPFLSTPKKDDLLVLKELMEAGKVRSVVERTYPLAEAADAIRYVETGKAQGKVVITV